MMKCASFFAGIGGIDKGFEATGKFVTVYANEYDPYAAKTYEYNSHIKVDQRDIRNVQPHEIPDFDILLAGFPCQTFSIAGKQQGLNDEKGRGTLFFELIRLIKDKKPPIVFLENVKHLVNHNNGKTFKIFIDALERENYHVSFSVLNAKNYGNIPQNRERLYIVGFKDKTIRDAYTFPKPIPLTTKLNNIINFETKVDDKYYYIKGKYKNNIYEKLIAGMSDTNDICIYQWRRNHVRKNKQGLIPTLTANQGSGGHNVCLIKTKYGIRKMTPRECFNAQGFSNNFKLPSEISDTRRYKQAGNSVCVPVITRIAECIFDAIDKTTT